MGDDSLTGNANDPMESTIHCRVVCGKESSNNCGRIKAIGHTEKRRASKGNRRHVTSRCWLTASVFACSYLQIGSCR